MVTVNQALRVDEQARYTWCTIKCMRTNLVLNDDLVQEAMRYSPARTKRALVEEALKTFVEVKAAERRRESYRDRLRKLDTRLQGLKLRESPSEVLRRDRDRR